MLQVGVVVAFLAASALYAAPSLLAVFKGSGRWLLVVALNIALGWTVVGWLIALALALDVKPRRPAWAKRARKPRVKPAAVPRAPVAEARPVAKDVIDPPEIHEDVYAAWLDQGEAMPSSEQNAG